jgi:hypothetical protein
MTVPQLQLMTRQACCLCEDAEAVLKPIAATGAFELQLCDVDATPLWAARYGMDVPVLLMNGEVQLKHCIEKDDVMQLLAKTAPRAV